MVSRLVASEIAGENVTKLLLDRLTRGGKMPLHRALEQLTTWESLIVQHVLGYSDLVLSVDPPSDSSVQVTSSPLSGISLWQPRSLPEEEDESLGWLSVPQSILDMVDEQEREATAREEAEMRHVDELLRVWEVTGDIPHRVELLQDFVERVETVYIFIGRQVYSKSDAGSNTLTKDGLLESLRTAPVRSWRPSDRLFVVAAHCLFISGRSVRFEEFNGRQLTATRLRQFLLDRYANYCAAIGRDPGEFHSLSLITLAGRVRELIAEVDQSPLMRYRRIHGLTFVKSEYLAKFPLPREPDIMPPLIEEYGRRHLNVSSSGDVRSDLRAMTLEAVRLDANRTAGGECNAVGELLAAIVLSAVHATKADYGMSSCVRNLTALRGARSGAADGVLALTKPDFFCCCLPHPVRMGDMNDDITSILWRAAQRMMFNRWHFIPGEFGRAEIPAKRHYYFAPQVPDIAEHCDHHHGGHSASRVRFTIRAPGAQVWRSPFTIFGSGFRGCYDIRVVRMEGPPFTMTELAEAVRHCSLVDELWRTLAACAEKDESLASPVTGFDRAWYKSHGWRELKPYRLAMQTAATQL